MKAAAGAARPGDIVLLAPACSSFDQFESYEHRGRVFKELVHEAQGSGCMPARVGVDKWIFFTTLLLVSVGLAMVFSASAVVSQERYHSPYIDVSRQAVWALAGVLSMIVLMRVDYTRYNSPRFIYPALSITTLLLVMVFFFKNSHATHRWIRFGGFFTFQPSELSKPVLILFLAWFSAHAPRQDARLEEHPPARGVFMPIVFMLLVVKEPDLGTALVLVRRHRAHAGPRRHGVEIPLHGTRPPRCRRCSPCSSGSPGAASACSSSSIPNPTPRAPASTSTSRSSPSAPAASPAAASWKACRSSSISLKPPPISSSPTSPKSWASSAPWSIVILFGIFAVRGLRVAFKSQDPFARLTAFGLTIAILLQAFFNISVVLSLVPTKGIPLPLISTGGTSLFVTLSGIGILLNISRKVD